MRQVIAFDNAYTMLTGNSTFKLDSTLDDTVDNPLHNFAFLRREHNNSWALLAAKGQER